MSGTFPCYRRAPSKELLQLLKPRGFLSPLLDLNKREVQGLRLDVHFRLDDTVAVYCGRANVLQVRLNPSKKSVQITAHDTYRSQCRGLFGEWPIGDSGFGKALCGYFGSLQVNPIFTKGEGRVQLNWSKETKCWTTFDREARLRYETTNHRNSYTDCSEIFDARKELDDVINADGKTWAKQIEMGYLLNSICWRMIVKENWCLLKLSQLSRITMCRFNYCTTFGSGVGRCKTIANCWLNWRR